MAIERSVIRYLPYDVGDYGGSIGIRRSVETGPYGAATAAFPGREAYASVGGIYDEINGYVSYFSSLSTGSAGLTGAVREFEFILLGSDGVTLEPLSPSDTDLVLAVGADNGAVYGGGVVEVGVYEDGVYSSLAWAELGIPYDFESNWKYMGIFPISLVWGEPPAAPRFWTDIRGAYEV